MHNLLEAASEDPTVELFDEEKEFSLRIEELEKKLLGKKQELVMSTYFLNLVSITSSICSC